MALNSNALITVADLRSALNQPLTASELMAIYHDQSASASAATVQVTATQLLLVITGGANAGTTTYTLNDPALTTITALCATINALAIGWVATPTAGNASVSGLGVKAQTSAYGPTNTQYLNGTDVSRLEAAINQASQIIETWTGRVFASTTYNHFYDGKGLRELKLRHSPIIRVERVALGKRQAAAVYNTSTDAIDATVAVESGSVRLEVIGGASANSTQIAFTGSTTLASMLSSINGTGFGWTASIDAAASGTWLFTDVLQFNARTARVPGLPFFVPAESIDRYDVNAKIGVLYRSGASIFQSTSDAFFSGYSQFHPYELKPITGQGVGPVFPEGRFNVFVRFTAGYATIPADVQNIAIELASNIFWRSSRDSSLQSESVVGYSWTAADPSDGPMKAIMSRLNTHRLYHVPDFIEV